jgi:hypothetical protein
MKALTTMKYENKEPTKNGKITASSITFHLLTMKYTSTSRSVKKYSCTEVNQCKMAVLRG